MSNKGGGHKLDQAKAALLSVLVFFLVLRLILWALTPYLPLICGALIVTVAFSVIIRRSWH